MREKAKEYSARLVARDFHEYLLAKLVTIPRRHRGRENDVPSLTTGSPLPCRGLLRSFFLRFVVPQNEAVFIQNLGYSMLDFIDAQHKPDGNMLFCTNYARTS